MPRSRSPICMMAASTPYVAGERARKRRTTGAGENRGTTSHSCDGVTRTYCAAVLRANDVIAASTSFLFGAGPSRNDMIAASTSFGLAGRNVGRRWHDAHMTRTARYDHIALAKTLKAQLQVISRPQSLACGLSVGAIRHRTRPDGPWRILLPGVYLVDAAVP